MRDGTTPIRGALVAKPPRSARVEGVLQQQEPSVGPATTPGEAGGVRRRRRGEELHQAIFDAVLVELREQGYAG